MKGDINIKWPTRKAILDLTSENKRALAVHLNLEPTKHSVNVLGIFQCTDADWAGPVAVVEFSNGSLYNVDVEAIRFIPDKPAVDSDELWDWGV